MEWWEGRSLPFTWSQQESSLLSMMLVVSFLSRWESFLLFLVYLQFISWMGAGSCRCFFYSCWSVQFSSVTQSCRTLCDPMNCSMPGLPVHHQLPEFTQTHVHRGNDVIQPSHPLLSPSPPAPIPPSIRVFSNESTLRMRWPKYWSFSFSISPSNEHPGLTSFKMDWLDLHCWH